MIPLLSLSASKAAFFHVIDDILIGPDDVSDLSSSLLSCGHTEVYDLLRMTQADIDALVGVNRGERSLLTQFQDFVVARHQEGNPIENDWGTLTIDEFDSFRLRTAISRLRWTSSRRSGTISPESAPSIPAVSAGSFYESRVDDDPPSLVVTPEPYPVVQQGDDQKGVLAVRSVKEEVVLGIGFDMGLLYVVSHGSVSVVSVGDDASAYPFFDSTPRARPPGEPPPACTFLFHHINTTSKDYGTYLRGAIETCRIFEKTGSDNFRKGLISSLRGKDIFGAVLGVTFSMSHLKFGGLDRFSVQMPAFWCHVGYSWVFFSRHVILPHVGGGTDLNGCSSSTKATGYSSNPTDSGTFGMDSHFDIQLSFRNSLLSHKIRK